MRFTITVGTLMALLPATMSVAVPEPEVNININLPVGISLVIARLYTDLFIGRHFQGVWQILRAAHRCMHNYYAVSSKTSLRTSRVYQRLLHASL